MAYQDGNFTNAIQDGPARIFYPFINAATKDNVTKGTVRNYVVVPSSYTPAAALSTDPADNTQYLVEETDLTIEGGLARYARSYSKVPQTQIEPGTIVLSKPTIPGNEAFPRNFGSYLIVQPDTTLEAYDAYKRANVTSDTGVPGFYPTGGTYTLSFNGNTTSALNYAANAATVQTAFNALTPVQNRGNVTVGGSYNSSDGLSITFGSYSTGTLNTASIVVSTDSTLSSSVVSSNGGYSQAFEFRNVTGTLTNTNATQNVAGVQSGANVVSSVQYFGPLGRPREWRFQVVNAIGWNITGGTFTTSIIGGTSSAINVLSNVNVLTSDLVTAINGISQVSDIGGATISNVFTSVSSGGGLQYDVKIGDGRIVSGTFVVSLFSETTSALNYNSNVTAIENAINSLSNVQSRGNVVVTTSSGTSTIINNTNTVSAFVVNFSNNQIGSNAVSLTPTGSLAISSTTDGGIGRTQKITFSAATATRTIYSASHGIDAGENIFLRNAASVFANVASSKVTVIDSNTIQLAVSSSDSWANVASFTEIGPRTKQGYEPGSVVIRSKTTTDFYLPGVTSGITTADDIPIPVDESGTAAFLQAAFSGQDNINVRVGELRPWKGPILMVDRTSVNADDV